MKTNTSILPKLLFLNPCLAYKMARGFVKMGLAKLKKKRSYGYDHMKDFCLIYMKLTPSMQPSLRHVRAERRQGRLKGRICCK